MAVKVEPQLKPTAGMITIPITYGIWIIGQGWLRDTNGRYFADPRLDYAKTALKMWVVNKNTARIELIDDSMIGLQSLFIERERYKIEQRASNKSLLSRLRRYLYGLLG
jgi:hypothetical protein